MGLNPIVQMAFGCAPLCIRLAAFLSAVNASWCQLVCQRRLRTLLKLQRQQFSQLRLIVARGAGIFAIISSHRPVPALLTFVWSFYPPTIYHSSLLQLHHLLSALIIIFASASRLLRDCFVTASFEVVTLQTTKAALLLSIPGGLPIIDTSN